LSFKELFVYLRSEEGRGAERPSSTGKKSDSQLRGKEKGDNETTFLVQQLAKEKASQQKEVSSEEQVIEIIRSGVIEQKVFEAGEASQEVKEKAGYPQGEQQETDGIEDASLHARKASEDTGEPSKEGVIVYEGTVLKTVPGFTVIPFEEARVEMLHAQREEGAETREEHAAEVLAKLEDSSLKEVEKEKDLERVEVLEVQREEEAHIEVKKEIEAIRRDIYRGRGLLSEEATIKVSSLDEKLKAAPEIKGKTEPEGEVIKEETAEVEQPADEQVPAKEARQEAQPDIKTGLLLGSVQGGIAIPLPLTTKEQVEVKAEAEEQIKEQVEVKAEVEEQIKEQVEVKGQKQKEQEKETVTETKTLITKETKPPAEADAGLFLKTIPGTMTIPSEDKTAGDKLHDQKQVFLEDKGKEGTEMYQKEEEAVQEPFEFEETFDRSRVEEKLRYMESSLKEKDKKIKGTEAVPEEPELEVITEKISIPDESQGEPEKPVVEIAALPVEQAYPEDDPAKKEKDTDLKEKAADMQPAEKSSVKQIVLPDISRIETGLLLASTPGKTTVPFEEDIKRALPEERIGDRKEPQVKVSEEKEAEPFIERIIDMPFAAGTEKPAGLNEEHAQEENTKAEEREESMLDVVKTVHPENSSKILPQGRAVVSGEQNQHVTAEVRTAAEGGSDAGEKKPLPGISLPDVFFRKDIKIEISMIGTETAEVSFRLIKKKHPLDEKKDSTNRKEIELVEDAGIDYTDGYKRVLSAAKAEKGVYIFVLKNNGSQAYEADVLFFIFEGKPGERKKEYKTVALPPDTTLEYKFIMPEAVFWDDEDYFTGTIESSKTLTKFNEKTGLIWKEDKDR